MMFSTARTALLLSFLVFSLPLLAQKPPNSDNEAEEKQRRSLALMEQILVEARGLRLPENRAFVAAKAGAVLWKADQKRARGLFESSITDLIAGQAEAETERQITSRNFQPLKYGQQPRWTILFIIGSCDAAFALEAMNRSRTARLDRAIADSRMAEHTSARQYANEESQNEQRLLTMAADQDPALAIRQVRDSLKRGVNYYTLSLLRKIASKDAEAASRLSGEAIRKLLEEDFRVNMQSAETLSQFLSEAVRETQQEEGVVRIPEELAREMADKLLRFWLDKDVTTFYGRNSSFALVEKYFPDRAARAKQKFDEIDKRNQAASQHTEYVRLMAAETPIEEMISGAPRIAGYMRTEVYRRAADRLAQNGNVAQAEKVLMEYLPHEDAENYIVQLKINSSYRMIGEGKFDEALAAIESITSEDQKINLLINLATSIYHRNPKENEKMAGSVLGRARALLPDEPETFEDISGLFNLALAYAPFDPAESFRMAEPLVPVLNELDGANATITRLRNYGNFRRGEFQITSGLSMGISGMESFLRALKDKDFDRALQFTNGFSRLETRISLQMQLIDENLFVSIPINTRGRGWMIDGPHGEFIQEYRVNRMEGN